jgi:hypothetical protein
MLLNNLNQPVNVAPTLHSHSAKGVPNHLAIAVLAPLREVLEPSTMKCGDMFRLGTRAKLKQ